MMPQLHKTLFVTLLALPVVAAPPQPVQLEASESASPAEVLPDVLDDGESQSEQTLSEDDIQQLHIQALDVFGLRDAELQQLEALDSVPRAGIAVRLGQQERTIRLYPYSLRTPDFLVLVPDEQGALVATEIPPPTTYRGRIEEDPGSQVAASVIDGRLHALILADNGEQWGIQPVSDELPSAPANLHVVYRVSDVIAGEGTCGVDDSMLPMPADDTDGVQDVDPDDGSSTMRGTQGRTEIAFDADFEFYQANGSSVDLTVQDIEMIMNQVGMIYQNQVGICYALTGVIVWSSEPDPYNAINDITLLCEFTDFWNGIVPFQRDVAHLMTGKDIVSAGAGTGAAGIAWTGVVCNSQFTNCNGGTMHYGLSESRFSTNLTSRTILTTHELGHNWNACHCNQSGCTGGSADTDCGVMCSAVGCASTTFGTRALTSITNHRNSRNCLGTCYDPIYVDWNNPLSGNGSFSNPFRTVDEGVRYAPVGGEIIISVGGYPENMTINKQVTLTAQSPGSVVTIGD